MSELTVNVTKNIQAPIEKVFDAWLDAKTLSRFMLPAPGMPEPNTKIDPRVGGNFEILMKVGEEEIPHTGSYLIIDSPNKLVFTWSSPFSPDDSTVTLLFEEIDSEMTQVELTHVKFLNEESRDNHEGGWKNILEKLDEIL